MDDPRVAGRQLERAGREGSARSDNRRNLAHGGGVASAGNISDIAPNAGHNTSPANTPPSLPTALISHLTILDSLHGHRHRRLQDNVNSNEDPSHDRLNLRLRDHHG